MMVHVWDNRQCSAFQPVAPYEYPIGVTVHAAVPLTTLKVPPKDDGEPKAEKANEKDAFSKVCDSLMEVSAVTAATVATYVLHNQVISMGPVQASGIVAIASTLLLPEKLAIAALCGSFAGMVKTAVVSTIWSAALLGVVCAGVLAIFDRKAWFVGFGGRLGFISQCACTLQFLATELVTRTLGSNTSNAMLADFDLYEIHSDQVKMQLPLVVLFTVLGALFMRLWKHTTAKLPNRVSNSVAAVGVTGLLGGFLPPTMGGPAFCGSFVAMASPAILPNLLAISSASILAGLSQLALAGFLNEGWGGKLGTAAFMGVVFYRWLTKATSFVMSVFENCDTVKAAQQRIESALRTQSPVLPR